MIGDSNGKARTTRQIMVGADKVMRFFTGLLKKYEPGVFARGQAVLVNGDLGLYLPPAPGAERFLAMDAHVQTMDIRDGKIVTIYDVANRTSSPGSRVPLPSHTDRDGKHDQCESGEVRQRPALAQR